MIAGIVQAAFEEDLYEIKSVDESVFMASEKELSIRYTSEGRTRTPSRIRKTAPGNDSHGIWYCGHCHFGPLSGVLDPACVNCHKWKDSLAESLKVPFLKDTDSVQKPPR